MMATKSPRPEQRTAKPAKASQLAGSTADRHKGKSVAIVISGPGTGETGGAERFYEGLHKAFQDIGCVVEVIPTDAREPNVESIVDNYRKASAIDLSHYDFVVSTKVPAYAVRHPRHVVYLVHTVRVFDDMFEERFNEATTIDRADRAKVHKADFMALRRTKAIFAIGHEVASRLYRWRGLAATVIHPPMAVSGFRCETAQDYFFIPGRLHPWKRLDLLVSAVKSSRKNIQVKIAGTGEQEAELRRLIGADQRIELLGRIDDNTLMDHYARCLAVPFLTKREDYGYVTLEAFSSSKPVITCEDSGEPARLVIHGENGLVVEPTVDAVREALEAIWANPKAADQMGRSGQRVISGMDWSEVALQLADAAFGVGELLEPDHIPVTVTDMQPIDPPIGGGRLRLLGLYHGMGHGIQCTYVGSYDWPGEQRRDHKLTDMLREIDVPLSDAHHKAAQDYMRGADGLNVIDLMFSKQASLSPDFVGEVVSQIRDARVIVFSHPWVYPLVAEHLRWNQTVIYDSQNVEGFLRAQLLNHRQPDQYSALCNVVSNELALCRRADWILACSQEDLMRFHSVYGVSPERMRVVQNGVMAFQSGPADKEERRSARAKLGLQMDAFVGIFIGSPYGPNVDAAKFIAEVLAPVDLETTYVVAGGVGETVSVTGRNLHVTGGISEAEKRLWMAASDFAINPMMSGSGTNIKMFDFMAAGLPIVTTDIGARGIDTGANNFMLRARAEPGQIKSVISGLRSRNDRKDLAAAARLYIEENYAWERISHQLGSFVAKRHRLSGQPKPFFSVVVPSYERHDRLQVLVLALMAQIERDFEVVIVDQSASRWKEAEASYGMPFAYFHSPVKGAVRARNTGAMLAQGEVIAFIDDDCIPDSDWLLNARALFADPDMAGIEGLIYSDHLNDSAWRPVTNVGFDGIGFMTANLMVRSSAFQYLGGFDPQFDRPHFREDTDFGWRLQALGKVPYATDVRVFHPAQPRHLERESLAERTKYFKNDVKLFIKHPEKYHELFFRECHFLHNPAFIPTLVESFKSIGYDDCDIPDWILDKQQK